MTIVTEGGDYETPTTLSTRSLARPGGRPNPCEVENEPLSASGRSLEIETAAHPSPHKGHTDAESFFLIDITILWYIRVC